MDPYRRHWASEILTSWFFSSADATASPLRYLSKTLMRRIGSEGVVARGLTRSSGLATIAAMLFWCEQPKFSKGWLSAVSTMSAVQAPQRLACAPDFVTTIG